jgi:hypothetical protein
MQTLAIVDLLDEGTDLGARMAEVTICAASYFLVLERLDEALRLGIVVRIAGRGLVRYQLRSAFFPCNSREAVNVILTVV